METKQATSDKTSDKTSDTGKRLIDANALIDYIDEGHLRNPLQICFSEHDVVNMVNGRPTVDAVEVVRCKNCEFYKIKDYPDGIQRFCCENNKAIWTATPPDAFCSYGERRTNG